MSNHLRDLLETDFKRWWLPEGISDEQGLYLWREIQQFGNRAQCFFLGGTNPALAGAKIIEEHCHMPFDVCWFQAEVESDGGHQVVGVMTVVSIDHTRLICLSRKSGHWQLRFIGKHFAGRRLLVLPNHEASGHEAGTIVGNVFGFLSALHCTNVLRKRHDPSDKLQKARRKRGKGPLFSYWTLELNGSNERGDDHGGTHSSPRVHLRRGHPRQYAAGKWTWVQPCAVGNRALGMVHKDYAAGPGLIDAAQRTEAGTFCNNQT